MLRSGSNRIRHCHLQTAKPPILGTVTREQTRISSQLLGTGARREDTALGHGPSQESLPVPKGALTHQGCLRHLRMVFSMHGASQESHLHLLGKAQQGSTACPSTGSQRQHTDRHLHSGTRIFQGIPHTCSTPEAFHAMLEQC